MSTTPQPRCSKIGWPRQAFRLSKEIIASTSIEEVKATVKDMQELNLAQAPFDQMDILVAEGSSLTSKSTGNISSQKREESGRNLKL